MRVKQSSLLTLHLSMWEHTRQLFLSSWTAWEFSTQFYSTTIFYLSAADNKGCQNFIQRKKKKNIVRLQFGRVISILFRMTITYTIKKNTCQRACVSFCKSKSAFTRQEKNEPLQKNQPTCMISCTALQAASLFSATMTPFPAARPLAFTTKAGKSALWRHSKASYSINPQKWTR